MAGAIISQIFSFCLATILASEDHGDLDHGDCNAFHNENGDNDKWYGTFYKENCDYDKWHGAFYNANGAFYHANGDDDNDDGVSPGEPSACCWRLMEQRQMFNSSSFKYFF